MAALDSETLPGDYVRLHCIVHEDTHARTSDQSWMHAEVNDSHGCFAVAKLVRVYAAMGKRATSYMVGAAMQDMYSHNGTTFINSVSEDSTLDEVGSGRFTGIESCITSRAFCTTVHRAIVE